jgi:3-oxoacyl-[acyl-carrier protein] reductase
MKRLSGKTALVTGASSGIGYAIATELARQGAAVTINYFHNHTGANQLQQTIEADGGKAITVQADVRRSKEVAHLFSEHMKVFDRLDILVNNAGDMVERIPTADTPETLWYNAVDLNLSSAFFCCQQVIPIMTRQNWGRIVNMSSVGGRTGGGPGSIPYHSAKAGLMALTKGLAKELAANGITVNTVAPGIINTAFHDRHTNPAVRDEWLRTLVPMLRAGHPDEVAKVVAFVASEEASYMTGSTLDVNGGMAMY